LVTSVLTSYCVTVLVDILIVYSEKYVWLISGALFQLRVIYMSYKVLTPVNNFQLLLKLPILDKFRLATLHLQATQRNYNNWFRRNKSSHDLDSWGVIVKTIIAKRALFYSDTKHLCFVTTLWINFMITSWPLFLLVLNYISSFSRRSLWLWLLTYGISPTGCWPSPSARRQKTSSSTLLLDSFVWPSWTWRRARWQCCHHSQSRCQRLCCFSRKFNSLIQHRLKKKFFS